LDTPGGPALSATVESGTANAGESSRSASAILWAVDVAVLVYLALDIVAQILPPHYNPVNTAESDLAVGPFGYIMALNFVNRGLLSLAFLYALGRALRSLGVDTAKYTRGLLLLGIWGAGALLLALFPTDVPATPVSWHGLIHLVVAFFAFVGGALGALQLSLKFGDDPVLRGLKRVALPVAAIAVLFLVLLFGLPFILPHLASRIGGVTERVLIGSVLVWMVVVSTHFARGHAPRATL